MKIAYCTNVRLPSERAHGHQVAAVCDALAALGHDVTIFCPYRKNVIGEDYWAYHHADKNVKVKYLGTFDPIDSFIPKVLQLPILNAGLRKGISCELRDSSFEIVYTRTPALLSSLLQTEIPVILELHTLPNRGQSAFASRCNMCKLIVCLTTPMKEELVRWGVSRDRILVEPDAVDLEKFASMPDSKKTDVFTVGYVGSLKTMGHDKGVGLIVQAVDHIRSGGKRIAKKIAGGPASAIASMCAADQHKEEYLGFLNQEEIKHLYTSCDALIYPAPKSDHPYFLRDTSPLKIFEYMAANRPIIAADLPPIHDILDDSTAYFFTPGDSEDLAQVIQHVMDYPDEAKKKADSARKRVENYTWEKRMKRIIDHLT